MRPAWADGQAVTHGLDGLHCDPLSGALQSIFTGFGHNPLSGLLVFFSWRRHFGSFWLIPGDAEPAEGTAVSTVIAGGG